MNSFENSFSRRQVPCTQKKTFREDSRKVFALGYQDSNLEMTESESVALPFGDSPLFRVPCDYSVLPLPWQGVFFEKINERKRYYRRIYIPSTLITQL